jgi:hypothetical protein
MNGLLGARLVDRKAQSTLMRNPSLATQSILLSSTPSSEAAAVFEQVAAGVVLSSGAGVMQSNDLERIVEGGRARRARRGVAPVPEELVENLDQLVLADRELAALSPGMLNQRHGLAFADLVGLRDQPVIAELCEQGAPVLGNRIDGDQREVELRVGGIVEMPRTAKR